MGNPFASPLIENLIEIEASHTPKQWTEVGRLKSKKGCNRKAVAQCIAGHPRGGVATGRDPPTGGTADKVRKNFSKIAAQNAQYFCKKNILPARAIFFSKNEAGIARKFFVEKQKRK